MNISTMKPLVLSLVVLIATTAFGADGIVQTVNGTTVAGGTVKTTQTNVLQMNWDSVIRAGDLGSPNAGGYIRWSGTNVNTQIYSGDNSDLLFTSDGNKYYFTGGVPMVGNGSGLTNIPYAGVKGQLWSTNAVDGSITNVNAQAGKSVLIYPNGNFQFAGGLASIGPDGSAVFAPGVTTDVISGSSFGGTITFGDNEVDVSESIAADGSLLTALNASQLTSGTVPAARLATVNSLTGDAFNGTLSWDDGSLDVNEGMVISGTVTANAFSGPGSAITSLNAANVSSGTLSQSRFAITNFATYAAGTAYTMTGTSAALTFGTTQPVLTINQAGTYMIVGTVGVKYNGATYAAAQTMTFKLRRTNNTAADLTNGARTTELPVLTTFTGGDAVTLPHVIYAATSGDTVTIFGILSATPAAGSVLADSADIIAVRLY